MFFKNSTQKNLAVFLGFFKNLLPETAKVSWLEKIRAAFGASLGLLIILLAGWMLNQFSQFTPWIAASFGASAFLIFVLPSSPMAQPWSVIGGNVVSALIAIICVYCIHEPMVLVPLAVGLSILVMFQLRCLHPPAASLALLISLNTIANFQFVFFPVLENSVLLVLFASLYNSLTKKPYPHLQNYPDGLISSQKTQREEIDDVLARYNEVLDINRGDLANLISQVEHGAFKKKLQSMKCREIMTRNVFYVEMDSPLELAWTLLRKNHVKALPVIDRSKRVLGILTMEDFIQSAAVDFHQTFGQRLRGFIRSTAPGASAFPNAVGQVMSRPVRVISEDRDVIDLAEIFCGDGHHHIPVINENRALVGMITQSDFVKAIDQSIDIQNGGRRTAN